MAAPQKGIANSLLSMIEQYGDADFSIPTISCQVRSRDEPQFIVENAEYGVAIKVDVRYVTSDSRIIESATEAQPSVGARQRHEVVFDRLPIDERKLRD
ncbi:MAG: hypothetical protein V5B35_05865 [Candidatus Accumulibacter necessarius]|jgi:hypothetical protein